MYINKAIIAGNVTRDPELKSLPSGIKVTTFSVATNRFWKDAATGEKKEMAEYHNIVVFGRQAENCAQYVKKGSQISVIGRIQTRSWEQDGQKKYRTEIIAEDVQFGSRPQMGTGSSYSPASSQPKSDDAPAPSSIDYPDADALDINPDDIPF
jgi:single-strand DNA-binding protein